MLHGASDQVSLKDLTDGPYWKAHVKGPLHGGYVFATMTTATYKIGRSEMTMLSVSPNQDFHICNN